MSQRFSHVKYDEKATKQREELLDLFKKVEQRISALPNSRYQKLALTSLEETWNWAGKAIRDDQIERTGTDE